MPHENKMKELRIKAKLRQGHIVKFLNQLGVKITTRTYRRYENGEKLPDVRVGKLIAGILGVKVSDVWEEA